MKIKKPYNIFRTHVLMIKGILVNSLVSFILFFYLFTHLKPRTSYIV